MSCPLNSIGQPSCHITAHPDYPMQKFCATCKQRFPEQNSLGIVQIAIIFFLVILSFSFLQQRLLNKTNSNVEPIHQKVSL